jgi:hypothetical protein
VLPGTVAQRFRAYRDNDFDLAAIPPGQLRATLRQAIDTVMDTAAFNAQVDAEKRDAAHLNGIRCVIQ